MRYYKIGDRVRFVKSDIRTFIHSFHREYFGINLPNYSTGTVVNINTWNTQILIEFDNYIGGHDGHCWWIHNMELELDLTLSPPKKLKRHEIL